MHKSVLKVLKKRNVQQKDNSKERMSEDYKADGSEEAKNKLDIEETAMDYVIRTHDFTKISEADLSAAFEILRQRCPQSWTSEMEKLAKSFHKKAMTIRNENNLSKWIDPVKNFPSKESKVTYNAEDLILSPECWEMGKIGAGILLKKLLHHFTIYAPFQGRPFVRAWLEALVPCFSHWILRSYSKNETVKRTLKNVLGAFGQDGIVVCLADKGLKLLNSLQDAARAVEATGRGTVEQYYWKQLTEANCGGMAEWRKLASIPSWSRDLSQLHTLPADWLVDSTDFVHVFANIVSPEISGRFEELLKKIFSGTNLITNIKAGPAKTLARSIAKSEEYRALYLAEKGSTRWSEFGEKFKSVFGRSPEAPEDFVWNVRDFARCSLTVSTAREVLMVKELLEKHFPVVSLKNGYNANVKVKGSGYRDMKLLVEAEFDNLKLKSVPRVGTKTKIICEIQIVCEAWLENKKTTSLSYKILRATNLKKLLSDFSKYVDQGNGSSLVKMPNPTEVLSNGWRNLAKSTDFSGLDKDWLLREAALQGWTVRGMEMLVNDLNADLESSSPEGLTTIMFAAANGHDKLVRTLIRLKSNINAQDEAGRTALHYAATTNRESCIRVLIDAGASLELKTELGRTALDLAKREHQNNNRLLGLLQGDHVPLMSPKPEKSVLFHDLKTAVVEGRLTNHLDSCDVPLSMVSKLLATKPVVAKVESILQLLWFGGVVDHQDGNGQTALYLSSAHEYLASITVLLDKGANVNLVNRNGSTPLHEAIANKHVKTVKLLIAATAEIEAVNNHGWTPLHFAAYFGADDTIPLLVSAGANMNSKTNNGYRPLELARNAKTTKVLRANSHL